MNILVMKFGGTSVADVSRIKNVAKIIKKNLNNNKIIIVLSAMSGETDKLQKLIKQTKSNISEDSELIITSGEQVSVGLLSMILKKMNIRSKTWLGWQVPIITNNAFGKTRILNIKTNLIKKSFNKYDVAIVAGFQGITVDGRITSLGRGGSDTSAVAIAAAFKASRCDIYTDVEGVYSTDPRICKKAKKINKITYEEILEMSSLGAKVLQTRSVELAMKYNLKLQVLSSLVNKPGTLILNEKLIIEKEMVSGISSNTKEAKVTISSLPDVPGISGKIFEIISNANINVDMIVQNISQDGKRANLTFTIAESDVLSVKNLLGQSKKYLDFKKIDTNKNVSKISVIGVGMKSQTGVAKTMFKTLASKNINILAISTSEIRISVLIEQKYNNLAVKLLHRAYGLDD